MLKNSTSEISQWKQTQQIDHCKPHFKQIPHYIRRYWFHEQIRDNCQDRVKKHQIWRDVFWKTLTIVKIQLTCCYCSDYHNFCSGTSFILCYFVLTRRNCGCGDIFLKVIVQLAIITLYYQYSANYLVLTFFHINSMSDHKRGNDCNGYSKRKHFPQTQRIKITQHHVYHVILELFSVSDWRTTYLIYSSILPQTNIHPIRQNNTLCSTRGRIL